MNNSFSYYVFDEDFQNRYTEYQERYVEEIPERDKVTMKLVRDSLSTLGTEQPFSLIDIGCSTGNFLSHLSHQIPMLEVVGADVSPTVIDGCKANSRLNHISFEVMDILNLDPRKQFSIVVVNAVLYMFSEEEYSRAIASISRTLKLGGWLIGFDFCHPYCQQLKITETSPLHPYGVDLHFRSFSAVQSTLMKAGFGDVEFRPFSIPIDLERGQSSEERTEDIESLNSYTVKTETGDRLIFRGTLFQPWCHFRARKVA